MSEIWPITEEGTVMIRQQAIFNLKQLYKLIHSFADEKNIYSMKIISQEKIKVTVLNIK